MPDLRADLSFCVCGNRLLFLDLASDRYFGLGSALERSFSNWQAGAATEGEVGALIERGLLVEGKREGRDLRCAPELPARADLPAALRVRRRDAATAAAIEMAVAMWLRVRPLGKVIKWCGKATPRPGLSGAESERHARSISASLERSAFWLGASDRCLVRGIAAMIMCRRRGVRAELVFGVRVDPFAAHAWVQLKDQVVVGDFEQVRLFTPILSVS